MNFLLLSFRINKEKYKLRPQAYSQCSKRELATVTCPASWGLGAQGRWPLAWGLVSLSVNRHSVFLFKAQGCSAEALLALGSRLQCLYYWTLCFISLTPGHQPSVCEGLVLSWVNTQCKRFWTEEVFHRRKENSREVDHSAQKLHSLPGTESQLQDFLLMPRYATRCACTLSWRLYLGSKVLFDSVLNF